MQKLEISKRTVYHKIKQWTLYTIVIILAIILIGAGLFVYNKDKISAHLLYSTNKLTQGQVDFDDVKLSPFVQFPKLSITLKNLTYFEHKAPFRDTADLPIASIENVHAGINLYELLQGKILIQAVLIENGTINLVKYPDSTLNLANALKRIPDSTLHQKQTTVTETDSAPSNKFSLYLDKFELVNLSVNYNNQPKGNHSFINIKNLESSLSSDRDSTTASLNTLILVEKLPVKPFKNVRNLEVSIQSSLVFNKASKHLNVNQSSIALNGAMFSASGSLDLGLAKAIDLNFDGSDPEMGFVKLFFDPKTHKTLKSGGLEFKGRVKGSLLGGMPQITGSFGITNLDLANSKTTFTIHALNLKGSFNSGVAANFTDARLRIDTLSALLPDGYIQGRLRLTNFKTPELDYAIDLKTNLNGLSSVLRVKNLINLNGKLALTSRFKGRFTNNMMNYEVFASQAKITFDSVSFSIPDKMEVHHLNGSISGNIDTLCFNNVSAIIGNSDVNLNGMANNTSNLLLRSKSDVVANLQVSSNLFDLVDFLHFKPSIGKGFPYQIRNLVSDVTFTTNRERLFSKSPGAHFTIINNETEVTIEKMLPRAKLVNGTFEMGDKEGTRMLAFQNFEVSFASGQLKADVTVLSPFNADKTVEAKTRLIDFNPGKFFFPQADTVPKALNGLLNGYMACKLTITRDTAVIFHDARLYGNNLSYQTDSGLYDLGTLMVQAQNLNYNTLRKTNRMATLSADMVLELENLKSENLNLEKAVLNLSLKGDTNMVFHHLALDAQGFDYKTDSDFYNVQKIDFEAGPTDFDVKTNKNPLATLTSNLKLEVDKITTQKLSIDHLNYDIKVNEGAYDISALNSKIFGKEGKGRYYITPFKDPIEVKLSYAIDGFEARRLTQLFKSKEVITGLLDFRVNIEGFITPNDSLLKDLNGNIRLSGNNLIFKGINLDELIKNAEKSQNYDLVDMGAFMLAGPLGLLVSRGTSMSMMLVNDKNATTPIAQFESNIDLKNGVFTIHDMAFATQQYRVAASGWFNFGTKLIGAEIAVVDAKGCSKISQKLSGPIKKPQLSKLEVFSSLFSPVTNLYGDIVGTDCTPFYTGTVKHPEPDKAK